MTVSESIIEWLKTFEPEEYNGMKHIDTEKQSAKVDSFSLVREPVQNVKAYLSGRKEYTDHYTIQARLSNQSNEDLIDNNGFGEALEKWVWEKDGKKQYPALTDATVQNISVTTPFYVGKAENNNYVYQMTIAIKYEKEK